MAKIGFIGTGIMGKPMAQNLQKAGHSLFLSTHHDAAPADLLEAGAIALANPKEVAQEAEFIIVMVPDTPQVEDVLFRKDGIAEGVGPNKVVIDMSSISPTATKGFAEKIKATGAQYLDAPVSGGEVGAKAATLSIMVAAARTPSNAPCRCSRRWARTSPASAATATARPPRWPTRSSSR